MLKRVEHEKFLIPWDLGSAFRQEWLCKFTLKCVVLEHLKSLIFHLSENGKLMGFSCRNIQAHYNEALLCLNFGTPENNEFFIWDKWKIYYF